MLNTFSALEPALNRIDQDHQTDRAAASKKRASSDSDIFAMDTDHSEHQQQQQKELLSALQTQSTLLAFAATATKKGILLPTAGNVFQTNSQSATAKPITKLSRATTIILPLSPNSALHS